MLGSDPLMARHRKRPVSRHQAPGPDGRPASHEAPDGRLGSAMRRVVVTPTFAAGLGVVVAAVLAYPMQTVFSYVAPGAIGHGGLRCGQGGCRSRTRRALHLSTDDHDSANRRMCGRWQIHYSSRIADRTFSAAC